MGANKIAGITDEDIEWAYSIANKITPTKDGLGGLGTKGDAARHLALGWLAGKSSMSSNSFLTKTLGRGFPLAAIQLKESRFFPRNNDVEQAQDRKNNSIGFQLAAVVNTKEEFENMMNKIFSNPDEYLITDNEEIASTSKKPVVIKAGTPIYTGSSYKATK